MNIVQIVRSLEIGGLERLAVELAIVQKNVGHTPHICCLTRGGPLAAEAEAAGIPVYEIDKGAGFSIAAVRKMSRILRAARADIVHAHNEVVHHYAVLAGRLAGVPVIGTTIHGGNKMVRDLRQERHFRYTAPWADAIFMVSASTRETYAKEKGIAGADFRVIPNGVPVRRFIDHPARPGEALPRVRFGTAARLTAAKDHRNLIAAFALVRAQIPEAELHLAGDGELRAELEQQAGESGVGAAITFHGPARNIPEFLSELDVFVLSSRTEGMPISLLEAMSAGLPIVSTSIDGIPEILRDPRVARLCPAADHKALAEAMIGVCTASQLKSMGEAARTLAIDRHSIARTWQDYEAVFENLLASRSKRSYLRRLIPVRRKP